MNQPGRTDEALMTAYAGGDREAFDELMRRHQPSIQRFLRRQLQDDALAEDALIDTFFKLHRSAATWVPRARLTALLFTLAYREAISIRRARRRDALSSPEWRRTDSTGGHLETVACRAPDAEASVQMRQELDTIEQAMRRLPEVQRAAFTLYHQEGLSTEEVAAALEIPVGSVRAYLTMARQAFREAIARTTRPPAEAVWKRR